ncbi:MAG: uroporphyrinogen-III C-methyltransferase [Burkholderiaceae bacterium]|jgi:uroporphyrin-III C-methyltransferase|nr:uroporphyrinogen-III C-methyltransferase [Burkholderiaceae bacterium]
MEQQVQAKQGKVWLIGVGPGDAELLTLKAARVLREAEVWLVDDLVGPDILALAPPGTLVEPVGKRGGRHSVSQRIIEQRMLAHVLAGRQVARVKGGDPLLFGRGGEELDFLRAHGIGCEVINGITSAAAAAQALGIALTHREHGHGVSFVTAHTATGSEPNWRALVASGTTLAIYMGMHRLEALRDALREAGLAGSTPAAIVMQASRPDVRCWQGVLDALADARAAGLASPAIILIGGVAGQGGAVAAQP